jgi:hypothetical protein
MPKFFQGVKMQEKKQKATTLPYFVCFPSVFIGFAEENIGEHNLRCSC